MKLAALLATIGLLVGIYFLEGQSRWAAGTVATLPLKTLATSLMVWFATHNPQEVMTANSAMMNGAVASFLSIWVIFLALKLGYDIWLAVPVSLLAWGGAVFLMKPS